MAIGINTRNRDLESVLQSMLDRIESLERAQSLRVGPIGGALSSSQGFTISVDIATGKLKVTSDAGTVTFLALP